jgi:hypothetical protein
VPDEEGWPPAEECSSKRGSAAGTQREAEGGTSGGSLRALQPPDSGRGCPCPESRRRKPSAARIAERRFPPSELRAGCTKRTSGDGAWAIPTRQWTAPPPLQTSRHVTPHRVRRRCMGNDSPSQRASLGRQFPELDVAKLGPHRLAGVQLQRQDALAEGVSVVVGEIEDQGLVEVMADPITLGEDPYVVPVVEPKELLARRRGRSALACPPRRR